MLLWACGFVVCVRAGARLCVHCKGQTEQQQQKNKVKHAEINKSRDELINS